MKRDKRSNKGDVSVSWPGFYGDDSFINKEKSRARELRQSAWWKKKISYGICYYCGRKFSPSELTMDHKIPLSKGGNSDKENIVTACKECNNKKKYMLPTEWDEYMNKLKDDVNG
jgi:5-methylcytosine-specific restriction endonuclease McrA